MRKLEIADPEIMRIDIQQEIVRSGEGHGVLINCVGWQGVRTLSYGAWTNAISSNMALSAGWGYHRRSGARC